MFLFSFVLFLRRAIGMQFTRFGSSTSCISGIIALCVGKYQCENEIEMLLVSKNINEQTAVNLRTV